MVPTRTVCNAAAKVIVIWRKYKLIAILNLFFKWTDDVNAALHQRRCNIHHDIASTLTGRCMYNMLPACIPILYCFCFQIRLIKSSKRRKIAPSYVCFAKNTVDILHQLPLCPQGERNFNFLLDTISSEKVVTKYAYVRCIKQPSKDFNSSKVTFVSLLSQLNATDTRRH